MLVAKLTKSQSWRSRPKVKILPGTAQQLTSSNGADLHAHRIIIQADDPAITCKELKYLQGHAAVIVSYDNTALIADGIWTLCVKPN